MESHVRPMGAETMTEAQHLLLTLFKQAAEKLALVDSPADAEAEMARFLEQVAKHPHERAFVSMMFERAIAQPYVPLEFLQYCFQELRWDEMEQFVRARLAAHRDRPHQMQISRHLLDAFDDNWPDAELYERFRPYPREKE